MRKIENILFITNAIQFVHRTYPFGKRLEKRGYKIYHATYSRECEEYLKEKGEKVFFILDDLLRYKPKGKLEEELSVYEKKYNLPSLNLLILGDKNYKRKPRKETLIGLIQHFKFWEDFFSKHKIDAIIGGVEGFIDEVPRIIIEKLGGIHLSGKTEPLKNTFSISPGRLGRIYLLDKYWEINQNKELTKEDKEWAEEYIEKTIKNKEGINLVIIPPAINFSNIKLTIKRFYINLVKEKMRNPYADLFKIIKFLGARAIRKNFTKSFHETPPENEKYVYYPLHRAADAAVLVRSPQYANQFALVENIANHLPIEYKLYIKEHPNGVGEIALKELKKLRKIPNVRMVDPQISSHTLIKKADCVFTINSNAGWEAMLYQKPVITFGNAFYDKSGLVFPLRDFYKFDEVFKKSLIHKFDYEVLLKFIVALKKSVSPGTFQFIGKMERALKDENNVKIVTEGIADHLKRLEKEWNP